MLPEIIQTARLTLRPPQEGDAQTALARWAADPEVAKYTSWTPHSKAATMQTFLDLLNQERKAGSCFGYMICRKGENEPIGMIEANPKDGFKAMMGYVIMREEWGKGYATEALTELVNTLFTVPGIRRVYAFCDVENPASAAVMRKAGMVDEGILRKYFIHPNLGQEPRDVLMLAKVL